MVGRDSAIALQEVCVTQAAVAPEMVLDEAYRGCNLSSLQR